MTPWLAFLETWLPPLVARAALAAIYAAMLVSIIFLFGYGQETAQVIYLDVR